jgi:type I restriction enzyme, S subunit
MKSSNGCAFNPVTLLIVEGNGSRTEIGRCAMWRGEVGDCVHQNHVIRVRPLAGV